MSRPAPYTQATDRPRQIGVVVSEAEREALLAIGGGKLAVGIRKLIQAHLAREAAIAAGWDDVPALLKPQAE